MNHFAVSVYEVRRGIGIFEPVTAAGGFGPGLSPMATLDTHHGLQLAELEVREAEAIADMEQDALLRGAQGLPA
ncbi:MAG: hypothetical protein LC776_00750 [Acidobacteria bacterium]|nr:hypothetical protein [Acidobacteriota bacterium]